MRVDVEEIRHDHPHFTGEYTGRYWTRCDGEEFSARQPFFEAARKLLAKGVPPETELTMWRDGEATWSLKSTVGAAAKLTVREDEKRGPEFRLYEPFSRDRISPLAAEKGSEVEW
jgi:hypothetical protein